MKYFSIDSNGDQMLHSTDCKAKEACARHLEECRDPDGWVCDDDEISKISWGEIKGRMEHVPAPNGDWQFELKESRR